MQSTLQEKIRKGLFGEVAIAVTIAGAVFWGISYINNPINDLKLDIVVIKNNIQQIEKEHSTYGDNAAKRDNAVLELGKKIDRLITILETKGVITEP